MTLKQVEPYEFYVFAFGMIIDLSFVCVCVREREI